MNINENKTQINQIKDRLDKDENKDLLDLINAKLKYIEDKFNDFVNENKFHEKTPSIPHTNLT